MSDIFLRSDAELDRKLAECQSAEEIREVTKTHFAAKGIISRERGKDWGARLIGRQPEPEAEVPLSASGYKFEREIRFAESTGKRTLVIRANTLEDLDALERQVTGQ